METCHILLGKPWQSKHQAIQDYSGAKNRYSFDYKGARLFLVSMTPQEIQEDQLVLKQKHTEESLTSAAAPARLPDSISTSSPTSARPPLNVSARVATSSQALAVPKFRTLSPPLDQPSSHQAPFFQFGSFQLLEFKIVEEVDFVIGDFAFSKPANKVQSLLDKVMKEQGEEQLICFRPNKTEPASHFQEQKHSNFRLPRGKEFGAEIETDYLMEYGIIAASKEGNIFLYLKDMNHPFNPGIYRDSPDLRTNPFQLGEDDMIMSRTEKKNLEPECPSSTTTFDPGIAKKNNIWAFDLRQVIYNSVQPNCFDQAPGPFYQRPRPIIHQFRGLI